MRLIDADALIERLKAWDTNDATDKALYNFALNRVLEAPTIEPERKRGKWYKPVGMMPPEYAGVYRCSKCDEIALRDWKHFKQVLSNFCPNCGADMRGEQNEID